MAEYSPEMLAATYELGRLYFECGYFVPAERIFAGLAAVDKGATPSRLGLGLIRLEKGQYQEAIAHLRLALQSGVSVAEAKVALAFSFLGLGEVQRAQSLLQELSRDPLLSESREFRSLYEAISLRCSNS